MSHICHHDDVERCDVIEEHGEIIDRVQAELPDDEAVQKVTKLIDWLEDYDDVQNVYHDAELPEEEEEE